MTPAEFNELTQAAGIYRKGIGLQAVADLATLASGPVPVSPPENWRERSKPPSPLRFMGKLIAHGFARLDGHQYTITDDGLLWLQLLAQHRITP